MEEQIICPNCKCMNSNKSLVCEHCGTLLKPNTVETQVPSTESAQIEQLDKNVNMTVNSEQLNQQNNDMLETEAVVPSTEVVNTPISSMNPDILNAQVIPVVAGVQTTEPQSGPYPSLNINQETQVSINQFTNKKSNGLVIKIVFIVVASIVVLALFSPLFSNYFSSSDRSGKRNESSSTSSNKDKIKDENGEEHTIGGKSKHYNDSLEDKVKYLLNSEDLDSTYNYIYINDTIKGVHKLFYNNGKEIDLASDAFISEYDGFISISKKFDKTIYDRYGEIVSENEFVGYDWSNGILRTSDDTFYNKDGVIGNGDHYDVVNQYNFSLLADITREKFTVINTSGKVVYEGSREGSREVEVSVASGSEDIIKYFAVIESENGYTSKIINRETGKVIYETNNKLEAVEGNLFNEKNINNEVVKYTFVQKDKVIFQSNTRPFESYYSVIYDGKIYEQSTGDLMPSDMNGMGISSSYYAYKNDGYEIFISDNKDIKGRPYLGLKKDNKIVLDAKYEYISFFDGYLDKELKKDNKYYVKLRDDSSNYLIYDLNSKKVVYDNLREERPSILNYTGKMDYSSDDEESNTILNILTGQKKSVKGLVDVDFHYLTVSNEKETNYYNSNLDIIYTVKEDSNN